MFLTYQWCIYGGTQKPHGRYRSHKSLQAALTFNPIHFKSICFTSLLATPQTHSHLTYSHTHTTKGRQIERVDTSTSSSVDSIEWNAPEHIYHDRHHHHPTDNPNTSYAFAIWDAATQWKFHSTAVHPISTLKRENDRLFATSKNTPERRRHSPYNLCIHIFSVYHRSYANAHTRLIFRAAVATNQTSAAFAHPTESSQGLALAYIGGTQKLP